MTTNYPLVTIGIPTYNRADGYLKDALNSAVAQTYPNLEIVVSDNCSPDQTETVVKSYQDPRIRYFRQDPALTPNDNFNFCLEQAQGDYFLLLHDDDMVDPDFVAACLAQANHKVNVGLLRTGTRIIDAGGAVLRKRPNHAAGLSLADFLLGWFGDRTALFLCSTLFNTKALKEIGGFRSRHNLYQDVMAEVQLAARKGRVDVQAIKASYRRHPDTRTFASNVAAWCEDSLQLLEVMAREVPDKREQVEYEGSRFLAKMNYGLAAKIKSPLERWRTYGMIYKKFNHHYSPLEFLIGYNSGKIKRNQRLLKQKVKRILASN